MAKAKKANRKAARPIKKAAARKAVAKPVKKPVKKSVKKTQKTAVAKKKPKRPVKKKPAPAPVAAAVAATAFSAGTEQAAASVSVPTASELKQPPISTAEIAPNSSLTELDGGHPARKKGVRKATIATGIQDAGIARRLGRSRIPVDAPLEVVFQNDNQAREAFSFLGIHSIRELEAFSADDLVLRLTGPAKITVGRIRKILAMNNRCLMGDEDFAVEFQELHTKIRPE